MGAFALDYGSIRANPGTTEYVFVVQERHGESGVEGYRLQAYDVRDTTSVSLVSERMLLSSYVHADILLADGALVWSYRDLDVPYSGAIEVLEIGSDGSTRPVGFTPGHADGLTASGSRLYAASQDDTSRLSGLRAYDISEPEAVVEDDFIRGRFSAVAANAHAIVAVEEGVVTCADPLDPSVRFPCGSGLVALSTGVSVPMQRVGQSDNRKLWIGEMRLAG